MPDSGQVQKVFGNHVIGIGDGEAEVIDTRGLAKLTIITDGAATATYSRVDSKDASAHTAGSNNGATVSPDSALSIDVDWPFFRVSSAGGSIRVASV